MNVRVLLIALLVTNCKKIYVSQKMIHKSYFLEARGFTMSDNIKNQNSNLFINLSEKQQESISGGRSSSPFEMFYMFYQNTNVYTRGISEMSMSQGNLSGTSRNETEYQFSQTTFILSSLFGGGGGGNRRNRRRRGNSFLSRIFSFL
jgi:hypothetical protein